MPASSESVLRWAPSRGESSCAHCTSSPEGHKGYIPYEPYSAICESPSLRESPPPPPQGRAGRADPRAGASPDRPHALAVAIYGQSCCF